MRKIAVIAAVLAAVYVLLGAWAVSTESSLAAQQMRGGMWWGMPLQFVVSFVWLFALGMAGRWVWNTARKALGRGRIAGHTNNQ